MNAIEIRNLSKSFRGMYALDHLNMTVPVGAIYGFIGENGSGKSTTEKLICGHLVPDAGEIKLFGRDYRDAGVRVRVGALIENAGCFPNSRVWDNLM
ncbi:MAG: ATP-binding cassette domain-containing protein, partial [Eubacteriales bacterium]